MNTEFVKELRTFSIIFSCEPMSRSINDCEYAGELLQRAANLIDTMNVDRETEILHAELNPTKPNCTECANWAKEQADNREWIAGVKKGREIVEKMAKAVIGKTITETEAPSPITPTSLFELWWAEYLPEATQKRAFEAWNAAPRADITRSIK
jgi:hypothetical protein